MPVFSGLYILFTLTLTTVASAAIGPHTNLEIVNKYIHPDGFNRSTVLAGGTFPGPLIKGNMGDTFKINVQDKLVDKTMERSTSIHWHGLFQSGTNYNDGAGFVTQCPIIPRSSYDYQFQVPNQAGTFWYHSHVTTQYCDGLRGPLVVYDPKDPHACLYDVDDDSTVITLADWYHKPSPQVARPAIADSTLINGLGRYAGGPLSPLAVVNIKAGKRYRFRLISISCDPSYVFSIDGHNMTIIEVDGINVEPLVVDSIHIFAAQRYSFVLDASNDVSNYWIRAEPPNSTAVASTGINTAILRYNGASLVDPTTTADTSILPLVETDLHPLENPGAPGKPYVGGADVLLNLNLGFTPTTGQFTINNASFTPPSVPVLLQILSGARQASELLPNGSVFTLPPNKVIELSIPPGTAPGGPHPFHLHGHAFDVVRSAGSSSYNYANPVRRDVVSTGITGDNVTIRFVTDNPGPWFLHCHIDWHLDAGLAIVFAEDTADTSIHSPVTSEWEGLCPKYNSFLSNGD
jgi:iron transport multicopper oxidase